MTLEVAKTFERNSVRYRPGDPLPADLDKQTLDHYKRHSMVRPASREPAEKKPAGPRAPARTRKPPTPPLQRPALTTSNSPLPTSITAALSSASVVPVASDQAVLAPSQAETIASAAPAAPAPAPTDAPAAEGGPHDANAATGDQNADPLAGTQSNPC